MQIKYINQTLRNGEVKEYIGKTDESFYTMPICQDQEIVIVLDEIKEPYNYTSCSIGKKEYDDLEDWNMFVDPMPEVISYIKYEIGLSVWNIYNEKFEIVILLEKKKRGGIFDREVKIQK